MDIARLQESFEYISPRLDELTMMFYSHLFSTHPETKPFFKHIDLMTQRRKLAAMFTLIINNLERMEVLVAALKALGENHIAYGATEESYEWVETSLLHSLKIVFADQWDGKTSEAWTGAIQLVSNQMQKGASGDDDSQAGPSSKVTSDDFDLLMEIASNPLLSFHKDSLFSTFLHKKKSDHEMALAHTVQQSLIPTDFPTIDGYVFSGAYEPATKVGGDYYDWLMPDDENLYVLFGDVSGKGVPGALIMCRLAGIAQALLAVHADATEALTAINQHMCDRMPTGRFITLALLHINLTSHRYKLVNAGHQPPLYRKADGSAQFLSYDGSGIPIGIARDAVYKHTEGTLASGDTLVLYTDGVDEALNPNEKMYGMDRLCVCVSSAHEPSTLADDLLQDVRDFTAGRPQSDDVTIVAVSRV